MSVAQDRGLLRPSLVTLTLALGASGCHAPIGVIVLMAVLGSPPPYRAAELSRELGPDHVRSLGCVDLGVVPVRAREAEILLELHLGNHCDHAARIDVAGIRIEGTEGDGAVQRIVIADPRHEIRPLALGAEMRGFERLLLVIDRPAPRLCVFVAGVAPPASGPVPRPLCFVRGAEGAWDSEEPAG